MKKVNLIVGSVLASAFLFAVDANANGNHDRNSHGHHDHSDSSPTINNIHANTNVHNVDNSRTNVHTNNRVNTHVNTHLNNQVHNNVAAQGGDATSNANAFAHGGQGGQGGQGFGGDSNSASSVGDITISEDHDYPTPIGIAPPVYVQANGHCQEGYSISFGGPYMALGGGETEISTFCLAQDAAVAAMNAGIVKNDDGLLASGVKALRVLHDEFDVAVNAVATNIIKCGNVKPASVILLTQDQPFCKLK
jgi:hypothetical protein